MPNYKLIYFDSRGFGENIRFCLAYAKQPYEQVRLALTEYPLSDERKKEFNLPWGVVPVLVIDGVPYGECVAICRYIGRKYGFAGKTELEQLKCDELVDAFKDYQKKWLPAYDFIFAETADPVKKTEAVNKILEVDSPVDLGRFEKILQKNTSGWLVGDSLTWADIFIAYNLTALERDFKVEFIHKYSGLKKLVEKVESAPGIKEWIDERPQTDW